MQPFFTGSWEKDPHPDFKSYFLLPVVMISLDRQLIAQYIMTIFDYWKDINTIFSQEIAHAIKRISSNNSILFSEELIALSRSINMTGKKLGSQFSTASIGYFS